MIGRKKCNGFWGTAGVAAIALFMVLGLGVGLTTVLADDAEGAASEDVAAVAGETVSFEATASNGAVVKVDAPADALPEGSVLHAEPITETASVEGELESAGVAYDGLVALDVYFTDASGAEIEPASEVSVRFELPEGLVPADAENLAVQHLSEDGAGAVAEVVTVADSADATDGSVAVSSDAVTAEFAVESFSSFVITWQNYNSARINVYYVDTEGNDIANVSVPTDNLTIGNGDTLYFWNYSVSIPGHSFVEARYDSPSGSVVDRVVVRSESGILSTTTRILEFYNGETFVARVSGTSRPFIGGGEFSADVYLVYSEDEPEPAPEPGVRIEDTVRENGLFTAELTGGVNVPDGSSVEYAWYRSKTGAEGTWGPVTLQPATGSHDNLENNGQSVNVAYDSVVAGADESVDRYWYYVTATITSSDGTQTTYESDALQVPHYLSLQNGSFEEPQLKSWHEQLPNGAEDLVWLTTGEGGVGHRGADIELARPSADKNAAYDAYRIWSAAHGEQFAELNCEAYGALYQDVLTVPGTTLNWRLSHAGRLGTDQMALVIMPVGDAEDLTRELENVSEDPEAIKGILQSYANKGFIKYMTDESGSWSDYSGTYTVPEGQYVTRFFFVAVESGAPSNVERPNTTANLLDNVGFGTYVPPADEDEGQITVTKVVDGLDRDELANYSVTVSIDGTNDEHDQSHTFTAESFRWDQESGTYRASHTFVLEGMERHSEEEFTVSETIDGAPQGYDETSSALSVDSDGGVQGAISGKSIRNVTVTAGGNAATVTFTNSYELSAIYGLQIYKGVATTGADGTIIADPNKPLSDTEFTLYSDKDCTVQVDQQTTNGQGIALFSDLSAGTYYFMETKVKAGYQMDEHLIEMTISNDGTAVFTKYVNVDGEWRQEGESTPPKSPGQSGYFEYSVANAEIGDLPTTGSSGTLAMGAIGVATVTLAGVYLVRRLRSAA